VIWLSKCTGRVVKFLRCVPAILMVVLSACKSPPVPRARITQFKAQPVFLPAGATGQLCYGVENANRVELEPAVEKLLPASIRCIDIAPRQTTSYRLTAYGASGMLEDTKSFLVKVGAPQPRVSDLAASSTRVKPGTAVKVCFKVQNAKSVRVKPGKLNRQTNCLIDFPRKTTTYKITALGNDREEDSGTVTVRVGS